MPLLYSSMEYQNLIELKLLQYNINLDHLRINKNNT